MKKFTFILRQTLTAAVLGVSAIATTAHADILPGDLNRYITKCDVNKDGMISRVEFIDMITAKFSKMDAKDGMVDSKKAMAFLLELTKGDGNPVPSQMMAKADVVKMIGEMFDKADTKKAGMLNKKQFENFLNELKKSAG